MKTETLAACSGVDWNRKVGCMSLKQLAITTFVVTILATIALLAYFLDFGCTNVPLILSATSFGVVSLSLIYSQSDKILASLKQRVKEIKQANWNQRVGCMDAKTALIAATAFSILFVASFYFNYFDVGDLPLQIGLAGAAFASVIGAMIYARCKKPTPVPPRAVAKIEPPSPTLEKKPSAEPDKPATPPPRQGEVTPPEQHSPPTTQKKPPSGPGSKRSSPETQALEGSFVHVVPPLNV